MGEVSPAIVDILSKCPPKSVYLPQHNGGWIADYDALTLMAFQSPRNGYLTSFCQWEAAVAIARNSGMDAVRVVWDDLTETTFYLP